MGQIDAAAPVAFSSTSAALTHWPPSSAPEPAVQSPEKAASFDPRLAPADWLGDAARLAIAGSPARIVAASPAMLALFAVVFLIAAQLLLRKQER